MSQDRLGSRRGELLDAVGLVKRVRGVAYCTRSAPALANRCVAAARGPLNRLLADVRVTTDAAAKRDCFPSPGFGCCLVAETLDLLRSLAAIDESVGVRQLASRLHETLFKGAT